MALSISGVTLGNISGGPSSLRLEDLADVSIVSPATGEYLRYNGSLEEWQNVTLDSDVYGFLSTNLLGTNGVSVTPVSGPNTVTIGLGAITPTSVAATGTVTGSNLSGTNTGDQTITLTGDVTGTGTGSFATTLSNTTVVADTYGSATQVPVFTVDAKGRITGVTNTTISSASSATNLSGGTTGALVYQSAPNNTAFLSAGTTSQVLVGGASAPSWSNTPTLTGTNFTGIPNSALNNSSITIGSTSISLGGTSTSLGGITTISMSGQLTSTVSTGTAPFVVASTTQVANLNAATAGTATNANNVAITDDTTTNANEFVTWSPNTSGNNGLRVSSTKLLFNPSTGVLTATQFSGSGAGLTNIPNSALTNSSITIGSTNISLGGTSTSVAGLTGVTLTSGSNITVSGGGELLGLPLTPSGDTAAASKAYVDNVSSGMNVHLACVAATTGNLAATYNNGTGGVGSTLTANPAAALPTIDGVTLSVNDRVLVKDQTTQSQNGIYVVTQTTSPWILTRASDFDNSPTGEVVAGDSTYVQNGTANGGTQWVQITTGTITIGTSSLVFTQFGGPGTYTAGTGISISSNVISNTGVLSFNAGTTGFTPNTATTGAVTLAGTLNAVNGGTGQSSYAVGDLLYASSTTALSKLAGVAAGRYLRSGGVSTAPVWSTTSLPNSATTGDLLYASAANTYSNLAGVATGNALISGGTSTAPSWGKIGLTTHVSGTLSTGNGGTGLSSIGSANQILGVNTGATGLEYKTLSAGTNISITPAAGSLTVAVTGTVGSASTVAITDDTTTNATEYITWSSTASGNNSLYVSSSKLTFNPSTGVLSPTRLYVSGSPAITINATYPAIRFTETDQGTDLKDWNIVVSGSAMQMNTFDDSYSYIATPFNLSRTGALTLTSDSTNASQFIMNTPATGLGGYSFYRVNAVNRWVLGMSGAAETGSNAGSNFFIQRYSDAGSVIDVPLSIGRSTGVVDIGNLTVSGTIGLSNGSAGLPSLYFTSSPTTGIYRPAADTLSVSTSGSERVRVNSTGSVYIGYTANPTGFNSAEFNIIGNGTFRNASIMRSTTDASAPQWFYQKSRGTSASPTAVQSGDNLGQMYFMGHDGTNSLTAASIFGVVDGTVGTGDVPGRLVFNTRPAAGGSALERMRIDSSGQISMSANITSTSTTTGTLVVTGGVGVSGAINANTVDAVVDVNTPLVITDEVRAATFQQLVLNAGESASVATGQTNEFVYINAEGGLQINSSPDNWVGGWGTRYTASICDTSGNSTFPGKVLVPGLVNDPVNPGFTFNGDSDTGMFNPVAGNLAFTTNSSEAMRLVGNNLVIGHTAAVSSRVNTTVVTPTLQSPGTSANASSTLLARYVNNSGGPYLFLAKSRGATTGTQAAVVANDELGSISFGGSDGIQITEGARIRVRSTATATTDSISARMEFMTTEAGTSPAVEMTIEPNGQITMPGAIASTSTTTGTLVVTGGVGVSGSLYAGNIPLISMSSSLPELDIISTANGQATIDDTIGYGITLTSGSMNTTSKYATSIKWGSTDPQFTTANPKIMAAITAEAKQTYSADNSGGMDLVFFASPTTPGVGPTGLMVESMRISTAQVTAPAFNATSTKRVKKAVKNLSKKYLEKFSDLKPREYDRRDVTKHEFGFIAEEMALVYPEVVGLDDTGKPSGIDYGKLSTILTAKVQEQQKIIDKLQDQMTKVLELLKGSI